MPDSVTYRQASPQDSDFVFEVMERAMRPYVEATWGRWDLDFQRRTHASTHVAHAHRIIVVDGSAAGVLATACETNHLQLEKLYLLPRFHSRGLGSRVLGDVVSEAKAAVIPVRLRVLRANEGAQRFYLRHGFLVTNTTAKRVFMEWREK